MKGFLLLVCLVASSAATDVSRNYKIVHQTLIVPDPEIREKFVNAPPLILPGDREGRYAAADGQFPWMVRMIIMTSSFNAVCSGSLISNTWALGSYQVLHNVKVVAIEYFVGSADSDSPHMVRGFFNRWTYLDDGILHPPDFALFRIASPVTLTPYIGLIRLPSMEWEPNTWEGRATVISGWGGQHSMEPRFLQYGNFVIVSDDICRIRNNSHVVCAEPVGHSDLAMSTLGGARGAPWFIYEDELRLPLLIATHSWSQINITHNQYFATRMSLFLRHIYITTGLRW